MMNQEFEPGLGLNTVFEGAESVEETLVGIDGVEDAMLMAGTGDGGDGDFSTMMGGALAPQPTSSTRTPKLTKSNYKTPSAPN